jgi:hypothetical protein
MALRLIKMVLRKKDGERARLENAVTRRALRGHDGFIRATRCRYALTGFNGARRISRISPWWTRAT